MLSVYNLGIADRIQDELDLNCSTEALLVARFENSILIFELICLFK